MTLQKRVGGLGDSEGRMAYIVVRGHSWVIVARGVLGEVGCTRPIEAHPPCTEPNPFPAHTEGRF